MVTLPFRAARADEHDALTALERAAGLRAHAHVFPPEQFPYPTAAVHDRWRRVLADPSVQVGVAEDADGLAALVAFDAELVRHLAVRPDLWGHGLGRAALGWAGERAPVRRLWCLEENHRALALYEHLGWRPTGRRQRAEFPPHPVEVELALPVDAS